MKIQLSVPVLLVGLLPICALAQRDPTREILVFFKEGVSIRNQTDNGRIVARSQVHSQRLKGSLLKLGIEEKLLEVGNPKFREQDTLNVLSDGTTVRQLNMTKLFRVKVPPGKTKKDLIDALNAMPEVLYAESNGIVIPNLTPSDTEFNAQWALDNYYIPGADIHAEAAWDIFTGNPSNIIGIIDGGIDATHADLNGKISGGDTGYGWSGHGVSVSGVAAAESNNAQGISGVDWNAQLHPRRIDDSNDDVDTYNAIVDAVNYSSNVRVINNSFSQVFPDSTPGRFSITTRLAFSVAYKANRTMVVAAGNAQDTHPNVVGYPAAFENVLTVGASGIFDRIWNRSSRGTYIDVAAPGVGVRTTQAGGGYRSATGTSIAAPVVAGIASLLTGYRTDLANNDVENLIRLSADDLNNQGSLDGTEPGFDQASGMGRVNAERALNYLRQPYSLTQLTATVGTDYSTGANTLWQFYGAGTLADGSYIARLHEVRKTITFPELYCQIVGVWGRGATTGWSVANPNFGDGFCDVVPGTLTNTGVTLRTYIYQIISVTGQTVGWHPRKPGFVSFAYSVLGIKAASTAINGDFPAGSCSGTTQTFSLSNPSGGLSQVWSVSAGLEILGSNTGSSVVVRITGNGNPTLQATITNLCGTQTVLSKNFSVGLPTLSVSTYDDRTPQQSNYTYHTATAQQAPGTSASNYVWYETTGGNPGTQIATGLQLIQWPIPPCSSRYYQLRVTNACGMATYNGYAYNYYGCGGGYMLAVYPNQASDEVIIEQTENTQELHGELTELDAMNLITSQEAVKDDPLQITLHNKFGEKVLESQSTGKRTALDLQRIPDGIYLLKVTGESTSLVQRIVIQK
jgi:thermitase